MHRLSVDIAADALAKRYGRRVLFRGLTFAVGAGETVAITGPNGSGKSTLLRILAGLLRPTVGTVRLSIDGRPLPRADHPLWTGFVAPYMNLYDGLTARENLAFVARLRGLTDANRRIARVLEEVEMAERADDPLSTYSSGMKQRLRIAAAILPEPALLLLDEPSATLDAAGIDLVHRVVQRFSRADRIVIAATNVSEEAARFGRQCNVAAHR